MGHVDAPKINHLTMIDSNRLEIYWDQEVTHSKIESDYMISIGENAVEISDSRSTEDSEWDRRPIYEPVKKRVTLYIREDVPKNALGNITVQIVGDIINEYGSFSEKEIIYTVKHLQEFYSLFTATKSGVIIKSSYNVSRQAHRRAMKIIDIMLGKIPEVAMELVKRNAELAIYGNHEDCYDIPEHRGGADILNRPVEGFGGCMGNVTTSISEKNILRILEGPNQTRYLNECILVHEFAHAIHLVGINNLADQSLAVELVNAYENAKEKGLWPDTYIISNYEEYFATLSTIWFNVMAESKIGIWDGVRGPVNTRAEFMAYDRVGYDFFAKIYDEFTLPYPWHETPVYFPLDLEKLKLGQIEIIN